MKTYPTSLLLVLIALTVFCGCGAIERQLSARAEPLIGPSAKNSTDAESNRTPLKLPLKDPRIEVHKGERKLFLYADGKVARTYQIGLGLSPVGDKERQGDHRTPEGDFYIFIKNPKSAYYLSLGVSYPSIVHADRGLGDGRITKSEHAEIVRANNQRRTPPQRTKLGGDIFIHGNGAGSDWTWGCVALENADMKELYDAVGVGTPVKIKP
jgi:murein L,D-transpeptidase YafK